VKFARRVFLIAGIYGVVVLLPQYFLEQRHAVDRPPAITHAEYYYGFVGVALAWQIAFFMISRDPARFRPIMIAAILEKAAFGPATIVLFLAGRLDLEMLGAGMLDMTWGILFAIAWVKTRPPAHSTDASPHPELRAGV
jgi:hypothetical protein